MTRLWVRFVFSLVNGRVGKCRNWPLVDVWVTAQKATRHGPLADGCAPPHHRLYLVSQDSKEQRNGNPEDPEKPRTRSYSAYVRVMSGGAKLQITMPSSVRAWAHTRHRDAGERLSTDMAHRDTTHNKKQGEIALDSKALGLGRRVQRRHRSPKSKFWS